ncbi:O-methyltransferase-domain-containing protein, partial [Staphylotrichum tortipilum]
FAADGPSHPIPGGDEKLAAARHALIEATKALHALAVGPAETTRRFCVNEINLIGAIQVLCHFNVPQHVPLQESISIGELSAKTGLREDLLSRFVRMAAANYYFTEPRPGFIAHTAWSRTIATDEKMRSCVWFYYTELMPSVAKLVEAVVKFPDSDELQETAFWLAFKDTFFNHKEKHQDHMVKFGLCMDGLAGGIGAEGVESIARAYKWENTPAKSLVVDVGGGIGHVSAAIAREHPHLRFQVQDSGHLTEASNLLLQASGVADRVQHVTHNFFDPQPASSQGAAIYFMRHIMHDWPDIYCQKILRHLVQAMGHDSRIIICDIVLPEPNTFLKTQESYVRALDLTMLSLCNAKERSYEDWQKLFASVSPRLKVTAVVGRPKMGRDSLIEARLV